MFKAQSVTIHVLHVLYQATKYSFIKLEIRISNVVYLGVTNRSFRSSNDFRPASEHFTGKCRMSSSLLFGERPIVVNPALEPLYVDRCTLKIHVLNLVCEDIYTQHQH